MITNDNLLPYSKKTLKKKSCVEISLVKNDGIVKKNIRNYSIKL